MTSTSSAARELRLTADEMAAFANGSGDLSPLHTDPAFARTTIYGECIVYGGLMTLALLGTLPEEVLSRVRVVRSSFPAPALAGERLVASAAAHPSRPGVWQAKLTREGHLLARLVTAEQASAEGKTAVGETRSYSPGDAFVQLADRLGAGALDRAVLEGVGWASYVVGMGMPGFSGLCAAVDVTVHGDASDRCDRGVFEVAVDDPRTRRRLIESALLDRHEAIRSSVRIECFPITLAGSLAT
jgi:acyl dehydratase